MENTVVEKKQVSAARKAGRIALRTLIYIVLSAGAFVMVFTYLWMLLTSFKDDYEAIGLTLKLFPSKWIFDNYAKIWTVVPLLRGVLNMMVPYAALMMPQFRAFFALGMFDTLWPLILPGFFGNVSMLFFLVQYMKGISNSFFEAAKIDGAGYMRQFISVMLPMVKTAIAAQVIFWFIGIWND
ncbi:MAG: ABC transporter permease subunit [Clostridia bacterium]|nr:ABC transporter permease subunit [Clostridia bacterium]